MRPRRKATDEARGFHGEIRAEVAIGVATVAEQVASRLPSHHLRISDALMKTPLAEQSLSYAGECGVRTSWCT